MGDMGKIRPNKKMILSVLGVVGVLVIAAGAGVGLRVLQSNNNADNKEGQPVYKGKELPTVVDDAQNIRLEGDPDKALDTINGAIASAPKDEKYMLYIQQGNSYMDKGDVQSALQSYLEAEKLKETFEITSLLATFYEEHIKDNAKALEYYKKTYPIIPDSPMKKQYQMDINQKIQELQAKI